MLKITSPEGVELVSVIDPQPPKYNHTDVDGDRLMVTTALLPDGIGGVYFRTDPNGSTVPLADIPDLLAQIQQIADATPRTGSKG